MCRGVVRRNLAGGTGCRSLRLPSLSTPRQFPDFALIFEGQRLGPWSFKSRLQERDVPDIAPNELHENSVVRFCVAGHGDNVGE
jgi:hypothetical protein